MNRGGWGHAFLCALFAVLACAWLVLLVAFYDQENRHAAEMDALQRNARIELAAAIDTPYADGAWYQQRIHQLELENGALREQIAILEGQVSFLES